MGNYSFGLYYFIYLHRYFVSNFRVRISLESPALKEMFHFT